MIQPHGIDLLPELVELARERFPARQGCFDVANALYWQPRRHYDFVRTNLEYVPEPDLTVFIRRQHAAVAPGGRLIVSHYWNPGEPELDPGAAIERAGYTVGGRAQAPSVSVAWTDAEG